jgi:hypothetical protein
MSHYHQMTTEQPEQVKALKLVPNISCVLLKKQTIEVRETPLPILQPDGVLVKVIASDESILRLFWPSASLSLHYRMPYTPAIGLSPRV